LDLYEVPKSDVKKSLRVAVIKKNINEEVGWA
jgi:hypothetical protein